MPDRTRAPPTLVPLLSLVRRVVATEGSGPGTFSMAMADAAAGGSALTPTYLSADLFEAGGAGGLTKDLIAMEVTELKKELEARGEGKSGNKAWLRRRLHAAIVSEHLEPDGA